MKSTSVSRDLILRWLPVALWAVVISLLSSDAFSGDQTSGLLLPLLHFVFPSTDPGTLLDLHAVIRKLAHVTEYALLAVLVFRALDRPQRSIVWTLAVALLFCAGYAALDELHQRFVPSRIGSPLDVALDSAGAAIGLAVRMVARVVFSAGRRSPA